MTEKITGKELVLRVLNGTSNELSSSEILDVAIELNYSKFYSKGATYEQKNAQISSLLGVWTQKENCPVKRYESGHNGNDRITYTLKKYKETNIKEIFKETPLINFGDEKDISRPPISSTLRYKVWTSFWGNCTNGMCIVDGKHITLNDFVCGHIEAYSVNQNSDISNLAPICNECNKAMGTMDMRDYKKKYHNNIDIPCKIDIFKDYITKVDVIKCFEDLVMNQDLNSKYLEKAIELLR